jgi:Subtilase family
MKLSRLLPAATLLLLVPSAAAAAEVSACTPLPPPQVVVALIDTGINPYNVAFRDTSPLGTQYPGTYIPSYPKNVPALHLSLDAPSYQEALRRDARVWASVKPNTLYWIPGTRIVGAMTMGPGGTNCPFVGIPPANDVQRSCTDHPIIDDYGHGTMTASRAAGSQHSLAPTARIVEIEGTGGDAVRWVADQGWIDVQSNSWLSLVPPPANNLLPDGFDGTTSAFAHAANRMAVFAASGNGTAYIMGLAPTPTYLLSTAVPGVILVGGHDNGRMTLWSGAPAHVVADAYGGWAAISDSISLVRPDPIACCTSAASPYAAGEAAAIVLAARRILGDHSTGYSGPAGDPSQRILARGPAGLVSRGPLAKGYLTLADLRSLVLHTAEAQPQEGRDDGLLHPVAAGTVEPTPYGVGANPFCQLCFSMPVQWTDIPQGSPAYPLIGYGALNERSLALAVSVLQGSAAMPDRSDVDQFFAADAGVRSIVFTPGDTSPSSPAPLPYRTLVSVCPASSVAAATGSATPASAAARPPSLALPNTGATSGGVDARGLALLATLPLLALQSRRRQRRAAAVRR